MKGFPEEFDSIFRYIEVVSQRAAQLINGARPRIETRYAKPTLQAKEEVDQKLVTWRILTQEELEARRQALVEQFQTEITPEGGAPVEDIKDVLPTGPQVDEVPVLEETEEHDEDLLRLQRMIGFMGGDADEEDTSSSAVESVSKEAVADDAENAED